MKQIKILQRMKKATNSSRLDRFDSPKNEKSIYLLLERPGAVNI